MILLVVGSSVVSGGQDADPDRERDDRIGLADLAAYRSALSGRPTADEARPSDPPASVGFRELWDHADVYRGRRVTVRGRLERTFRQGAVGSFPPLAEAWIFTAAGDPFCIVYPRPGEPAGGGPDPSPVAGSGDGRRRGARVAPIGEPGRGRLVRFTGTFLKTVRYAAGDGERLVPLIVGDRPPEPQPVAEAGGGPDAPPSRAGGIFRAIGGGDGRPGVGRGSWRIETAVMGLILAAVAALAIARQHLRVARAGDQATAKRRVRDQATPDPPLHFVDSPEDGSHRRGPSFAE